jgi:nucleoid-associated protein YgaU
MSGRRLTTTTLAMAVVGAALVALTPSLAEMIRTLAGGQRTADTVGPDALVTAAAGLLAWAVWAWGALGLLLTAVSAVPGTLGRGAELLTLVLLPAGARRGAALALGMGLTVVAPLGSTATLVVVTATPAAAETTPGLVPDWPTAVQATPPAAPESSATSAPPAPAPAGPDHAGVPDWPDAPTAPAPGEHVVLRGDCLWDIAATRLADDLGRPPGVAEIADSVHAWWTANAAVIGEDPDLLLPGQVLRPPA